VSPLEVPVGGMRRVCEGVFIGSGMLLLPNVG
jgi:hypothetical protein